MIAVINIAPLFDQALKELFFKDLSLTTYLLYAAAFASGVYILAIFFVREIEMTDIEKDKMVRSDKWILFIYYLLLIALMVFIFFGYKIAKISGAPFWGMLGYVALNFGIIILTVPL